MKRILVACVGNIFHGDDAFGVEVARELSKRSLPEQVAVEDFGIRAYDLAYALTDNYDAIILADAMPRGQAPGTVCLVEPDLSRPHEGVSGGKATPIEAEPTMVDPHTMHTVAVLRMAQSLGGVNGKVFLVGCEPAVLECEGGEMGLSEPVRAAVPTAVAMIESLANNLIMKHNAILPAERRLERKRMNAATTAWIVVGGVAAVAAVMLVVHEIPAIRRELRLLRM